jgi:DeoR/GlpR family transcriptional regulator of sugar metabolism
MAHGEGSDEGRPVLAEARRRAIAEHLKSTGAVSVSEVETRFGVSSMTARRDLGELERQGLARRTHGGAVLPAISAHEDSFAQRVETATEAKLALAADAVALLTPRETVFLDSSSTSFFVARSIVDAGIALTVLTNSLPVIDLLAAQGGPNVELIGIGGTLRALTQSFVGPHAVRTVTSHFADRLFLSVKGVTPDGMLTDADPLEAEVKRAMIGQAVVSTLLLDRSKLSARGLNLIAPLTDLDAVIAHGVGEAELGALRSAGLDVHDDAESAP